MDTCYQGGAIGADAAFSDAAIKAGHRSVSVVFKGHKVGFPSEVVRLSKDELDRHRALASAVNDRIGRTFPTSNEYVDRLLLRNVWIGANVDSMFAVGWLEGGAIQGGTAWACMTYMMRGLKDLWFFDQWSGEWMQMSLDGTSRVERPPMPSGAWGATGSRMPDPTGTEAIRELFSPR